ncbi:hypothetical protein RchiOBHm_Chr1g0378061 [Rosa chinensis]|uniref:Uncharacterized protein n=1 Tax=Rosa chinensis TaxID=74649 RepID=A0A2P6SNB2_ROSCH|nr:hypothetical protein RchiOBHm_Chr1g0378061 [Rosa chinensis]
MVKVRLKAGIGRIYRSSSLILVEQDSEQITIVAQGRVIEAEDIYVFVPVRHKLLYWLLLFCPSLFSGFTLLP